MRESDPAELFERARKGDRAALSRMLSLVEQSGDAAREIARVSQPFTGRSVIVGITGAPGAGKSTLTSALIGRLRAEGSEVAVLAVDPSSPLTGGAILGDRVRMGDHATDEGVFIRSMATRGQIGGLTLAVPGAIRVLDAVGIPWIVMETVGVGQVGVDVAASVDTTVVVVNPGWGDAIQANKAGLLEIGDIFVVNKADRPGVSETIRDLERMLLLSPRSGWIPPVIATVATSAEGIDRLLVGLKEHHAFLVDCGELETKRVTRASDEVQRIMVDRLMAKARALASSDESKDVMEAVVAKELDPWTAVDQLLG